MKRNVQLIDHLTVTLQNLMTKHPKSGVFIFGDRNSILLKDLKTIDSSLKQIVKKPTRGNKILDIILTNLYEFYEEPIIIAPVKPDI